MSFSCVKEFDDALKEITQKRGVIYGHPLDDFAAVAGMSLFIDDCPDPEVRHALRMILVKVARLATSPGHMDSVVDIAGYARTIAMIHDERRRRLITKEDHHDEDAGTTLP